MTSKEIMQADLLDIVFMHRNREYGAYTLRKYYNHRMMVAMSLTFLLILPLLWLTGGGKKLPPTKSVVPGVIVTKVDLPKQIEPKPPIATQPKRQKVATTQLTRTRIVEHTNQVMADVNELQRAAVGNRRIEGIEPITNLLPVEAPTISNTNSNTMVEEAPVDILLSSEPEFPGGMKAWLKYLQRNLRIPGGLMAGETKTVLIRFKVDADGTVTGFEVLQSAGTEYDEEVMRVLRKMPRWKPALQQGVAVPHLFTQPVTFMGVE